MNKTLGPMIVLLSLANLHAQSASTDTASPDGNITVKFSVSPKGSATYRLVFKQTGVIGESDLGLVREDDDFSRGLSLKSASEPTLVTDQYQLFTGKRRQCSYSGNERVFHLENARHAEFEVIFRVSNDGVAFRYRFPDRSDAVKRIKEETTSFQFLPGAKAFLSPCPNAQTGWNHVEPCYEQHYVQDADIGTPSPYEAGWVFPALFHYGNFWIALTEAGIDTNYCGSRLRQKSENGQYRIAFPQPTERTSPYSAVCPESKTPWSTPWRIIALSDGLKTLVESTLGTDLAIPTQQTDVSYVKPGRAAWSWIMGKDDSITYDVQRRYIDWAAEMKWEYCLVDADWDTRIGYDKIKELADYARSRNVGLLLWYNSAGSWNTVPYHPKDRLLFKLNREEEFKRLKEMGVKGVKIDFFGGDGQSMMNYYIDLLRDADKYGLLVNFHGATVPRGWARTYPNLVSMEGVRGFEFVTFEQQHADAEPSHCCLLPFTRNAFDPMDFTPVNLTEIPGRIRRKTSSAFELALTVVFLSGVQHYAESPEGMAKVPDFVRDYMRQVPTQWDEVCFIDGYPGKFVVLARRAGQAWYIAGLNGEAQPREVSFALPFITRQTWAAMITDGDTDRSFHKSALVLRKGEKTSLRLKPYGGFVIKTVN